MSAFVLKIIALISMLCDHSSYVIYGEFSYLNYIGRIAFPIFAFQISEGYIHTKSLKKYCLRLLIFAIISQIPFMLFESIFSTSIKLNVFFTLFLGLIAIIIYDKLNSLEFENKHLHYYYKFLGIFFAIIMAIAANALKTDYGAYGVAIIFLFYLFKNNKVLMNLSFILSTIIYYLSRLLLSLSINNYKYLLIIIFTCIPLIFINLYNNKKGKNIKYLLYVFYPLHLLILYAISLVI